MKKLISVLLVLAVALIGFGIIAPDKMSIDGETKDLLYTMNEKGAYIIDGIKKVAIDIGKTATVVSKTALNKAKEGIKVLQESTESTNNNTEESTKIAKLNNAVTSSSTNEAQTKEDNSKSKIQMVIYSKADIIAFKIHDNPNDDISLDEEIAKARARYNTKNKISNNVVNKKIITEKNSAKKIIEEQKENIMQNSANNINFPFNSSELTKVGLDKLSRLKFNSNSKIAIVGHTDSVGSSESNEYYSKARAMAVKKYFVAKGINAENISISYSGAKNPAASNSSLAGRRANRRVEVSISN